ncbi:MAG: HAMP domain-containing protein [Acidobacteria bacterium]|nr:HAMP domain-containing protein [Acidobacteriota bacterium]
MRSLFLKIFLWFLAVLALVFVVLTAFTLITESGPINRVWTETLAEVVRQHAGLAIRKFESDGTRGLTEYLYQLERDTGVRLFLLDDRDHDLLGRPLPDWAARSLSGLPASTRRQTWQNLSRVVFYFRLDQDRSPVSALARLSRSDFYRQIHADRLWLQRLLLFLVAAGLGCFWLARHLTRPILMLQRASRRLAGGELDVRVRPTMPGRRDEIGQLARDFDSMAARLAALRELQQRLFRDISHELRSPLARLGVALELVRKRTPPEAETAVGRIEREMGRIDDLVSRLLDLAALESDGEAVIRQRTDFRTLVTAVTTDAAFEATARAARVVLDAPGEDPLPVWGSAEFLRRAVENVVRNAVRFTPAGTCVELSLHPAELNRQPAVRLRVRDHGPGVPEAELSDIFLPFYRVSAARERTTGGSGIGLAITERTVRLHQGEIAARNMTDGGLAVDIVLPLIHPDQRETTPPPGDGG